MVPNPFRETDERIAAGGLAARLLRNADPNTDPHESDVHRWPAAAPLQQTAQREPLPEAVEMNGEPGEWIGRWAVVGMFALTTMLAGIFLVLWVIGGPATLPVGSEETAALSPAPPRSEPGSPVPASQEPRPIRNDGTNALRSMPDASAGADPAPTPPARPTAPLPTLPSSPAAPSAERPVDVAGSTLSSEDRRALLTRGGALLTAGDLAAARPLLERAALAGDATAALRLGQSYDSGYLAGAGLRQAAGNLGLAIFWYRRSQELGNGTAAFLARKLETAARAEWGPISARPPAWRP
jgi:hypothetical protein